MPYFSVIIPLFNKELEIKETLNSVINQTFDDFEVIIVNDGSTDNSLHIVNQFIDSRIQVHSIKNSGVSFARNYGTSLSQAELITFIDADDLWHSHHLDEMYSLTKRFPDQNWYITSYEIEYNTRLTVPTKILLTKGNGIWQGVVDDYFANSMLYSMAHTDTVAMRKPFFNELSGFDINYHNGEDIDLWIRAALKSKPAFSSKITSRYRLNASNSISKTHILKRKIIDFNKYEKQHPHNLSLKMYLDLNRYSIAIQYKTAGNQETFQYYYNCITLKHLSKKQRFLLQLPTRALRYFKLAKDIIEKVGIKLHSS